MDTIIKSLLTLTLLVTGVFSPTSQGPTMGNSPRYEGRAPSFEPKVVFEVADADRHARVEEALALFEGAGLVLPPIRIEFFDEEGACRGHAGLFVANQAGRSRVRICSKLPVILLHELGHAWAFANLTDDDRAAYAELLGLEHWNQPGIEWKQRGTEKAANAIAYSLSITEPPANPNIEALVCTYEALTGKPLPRPELVDCRP